MLQDKIEPDELVERIAKTLCDKDNPMISDTVDHSFWEEKASNVLKKIYRNVALELLSLVRGEMEKCLLSDEELDDCYFNPPTTILNEFKDYQEVNRHIAKTQLQSILKALGG